MHVLACVPAYNEQDHIGELIKEILDYVDSVAVCDDGSSDFTSKEAKNAGAYVIKHKKNLGKGAALRSLFNYAKQSSADVIVTIDGDKQFLPKEIPKLTKSIIEKPSDVVIGNRFDEKDQVPPYRKFGNKILDHATNIVTDIPIKDTQSGFRAYSKRAIEVMEFSNNGFSADSEILISIVQNKLRITEENVTVIYNTGHRTSTKNPVLHAGGVFASLIEMILIKHPLRYLGIPGIILIITGIVSSVYVLTVFNDIGYFSVPYTLLAIATLAFGLLMILVSGLLFTFNIQLKKKDQNKN